jgi:hypothetical protein
MISQHFGLQPLLCPHLRKCKHFTFLSNTEHPPVSPSVCDLTSETKPSVEFSCSSLWQFCTRSSQASVRFVKTVSVTVTLLPSDDPFCCLLNIKPTNQPLCQPNTTNDSRNTKLQNYKQQSLQFRSQSCYSYIYIVKYKNAIYRKTLCDHNVTLSCVRITVVQTEFIYKLNVMSGYSRDSYPACTVHAPYYITIIVLSGCTTFFNLIP